MLPMFQLILITVSAFSLVIQAHTLSAHHKFKFKHPLYSIDSTTISLCPRLFPWADLRKGKRGIKLTVKLAHSGKIPCFVVASYTREHNTKKIRAVPYEAGDGLVFDRGYTDYTYFASIKHIL